MPSRSIRSVPWMKSSIWPLTFTANDSRPRASTKYAAVRQSNAPPQMFPVKIDDRMSPTGEPFEPGKGVHQARQGKGKGSPTALDGE